MTKFSKVTAKYQVAIPVKIRKEMGIVPGTEVDITKKGQKYVLIVNPIETIRKKWQGRFKGRPTTYRVLSIIPLRKRIVRAFQTVSAKPDFPVFLYCGTMDKTLYVSCKDRSDAEHRKKRLSPIH